MGNFRFFIFKCSKKVKSNSSVDEKEINFSWKQQIRSNLPCEV